MADKFSELDSDGVYLGMTLEEFGVRVSSEATRSTALGRADKGAVGMPKDSLREAIEHLRAALASGDPLSKEERARLDRVLVEVAGIIEPETNEGDSDGDMLDELKDFTERFEESHPELALILGRIMDSLSQLGI